VVQLDTGKRITLRCRVTASDTSVSGPYFRPYMASFIFSKQRNILDINSLVKNSIHSAVLQMYPILCITVDRAFQETRHVTATRRPAPLADKLVKYSQLYSPGDCVTTCYGSRDPNLQHTSIQQYKSNLVVQRVKEKLK